MKIACSTALEVRPNNLRQAKMRAKFTFLFYSDAFPVFISHTPVMINIKVLLHS